jgi:lysophospholipase L1-like esterase
MPHKDDRSGLASPYLGALLVSFVAFGCGAESATMNEGNTGGSSGAAGGSAGATAPGGASGDAGARATGGASGDGGARPTGGASGDGGARATGGASGNGGARATGGAAGGGGARATGGAGGSGASAGGHSGGASGTGGSAAGAGGHGTGGGAGSGAAGKAGMAGAGGTGALPNVTIWIAGDSTVMTYPEPNTDGNNMISIYGWGQEIGQFFNSKVTIDNQAIGGRSVAFFMWSVVKDSTGAYQCVGTQGTPEFQLSNGSKVNTSQWSRILTGMKAGDFLLIQFGTNDETHTCPRYVALPDFETDFGIMADAARARGATPIFVTPMGHRSFSGTTATNTLLPYANAMKSEAALEAVEVEDLNLESEAYYTSVGNSYLATNIFDGGTTHFIEAGAVEMATLIVKEVRKNNGPLAVYLK